MSEHQHLHFLACDRLLDDEQLAFMEGLSSHAEVSRREFEVAYHWGGGFRGDPEEMLRRGYDVHVEYANYGVRRVLLRLPGPPVGLGTLERYGSSGCVRWLPDDAERPEGPGLLDFQPDGGDADTFDWFEDPEGVAAAVAPLRDLLLCGDLRPLAIGRLAGLRVMYDGDDFPLPPVPAGLTDLPPAAEALRAFFEVPEEEVAALAQGEPEAGPPARAEEAERVAAFVADLPEADLREVATRVLAGESAAAAMDLRRRLRDAEPSVGWPVAEDPRTLDGLLVEADRLSAVAAAERAEAAAAAEREREEREARRRAEEAERTREDPDAALERIESSIGTRSSAAYAAAFEELSAFVEALGEGAALPEVRALAGRLNRRDRRPAGLLKLLREAGWLG